MESICSKESGKLAGAGRRHRGTRGCQPERFRQGDQADRCGLERLLRARILIEQHRSHEAAAAACREGHTAEGDRHGTADRVRAQAAAETRVSQESAAETWVEQEAVAAKARLLQNIGSVRLVGNSKIQCAGLR